MKRKPYRVLFITFVAAGLIGLFAFITGNIIQSIISQNYFTQADAFFQKLYAIESAYSAFGASDEANKAASIFLESIPGGVSTKNNILILDEKGTPVYRVNDNYLYSTSGTLNMAWSHSFAFIQDNSTKAKHWYKVEYMSGMYAWGYDEEGSMMGVSFGVVKDTPENIDNMLNAYYDINKPEANVSIFRMERNQHKIYLLWFRDKSVDEAIYKAFSKSDINIVMYTTSIGLILFLLYWLLAPVWVFLDARRRLIQPLPWALLVLLSNIVGLIVYWIVQSQNTKTNPSLSCPACGKLVSKSHFYCPWCADPLVKCCKGCGKPLEKEWVACPWCGNKLE